MSGLSLAIRTSRWQAKRLHAYRFDQFTKRSAELRIAIMQQIAAASQASPLLHSHVSCLLLHPFPIQVRRESCQAHPATLQVDAERTCAKLQVTLIRVRNSNPRLEEAAGKREYVGGYASVSDPVPLLHGVRARVGAFRQTMSCMKTAGAAYCTSRIKGYFLSVNSNQLPYPIKGDRHRPVHKRLRSSDVSREETRNFPCSAPRSHQGTCAPPRRKKVTSPA
jgi:hypothetical protein